MHDYPIFDLRAMRHLLFFQILVGQREEDVEVYVDF